VSLIAFLIKLPGSWAPKIDTILHYTPFPHTSSASREPFAPPERACTLTMQQLHNTTSRVIRTSSLSSQTQARGRDKPEDDIIISNANFYTLSNPLCAVQHFRTRTVRTPSNPSGDERETSYFSSLPSRLDIPPTSHMTSPMSSWSQKYERRKL